MKKNGVLDPVTYANGEFLMLNLSPRQNSDNPGNILHDWNFEHKRQFIGKAFEALRSGGTFVLSGR